MKNFLSFTFVWCAILAYVLIQGVSQSHCYANQTATYTSIFTPLTVNTRAINVSAFFSPDYSAPTLTNMIQNARSEVLIAIPGFSSWSGCTYGDSCYGCSASDIKEKEKFPVFQALVNALHRGVAVTIVTNDPAQYGDKQCEGKMSLLTYLAIAGAQVRYYTSTAFLHTKFVSVDQMSLIAISSINFSKSSIMKNREAGLLISGDAKIANFTRSVFFYDYAIAEPIRVPYHEYPQSDIALIRDPAPIPVIIPEKYNFKYCATDSPAPSLQTIQDATVTVIASPDFAYETIVRDVKKATKSFQISIYEVSSVPLCDLLIELAAKGVELKIFVSNDVYGKEEQKEALQCYQKLYEHNIKVVMSHRYCLSYSHQKFWIIDNEILTMSSGNWRESDYPQGSNVFPPMRDPNYKKVNRDFTVSISSASKQNSVLNAFQKVFDNDYLQGVAYDPHKKSL